MELLPLGKLPPIFMENIFKKIPILDNNIILGPGTGLDCAVIDNGNHYLVVKSDPISLASEDIGKYSVEINVNDIVTSGADPKWMMITLLLPENKTTKAFINHTFDQLIASAEKYQISIIGGHTEVTSGIERPILSATLFGFVDKDKLLTPKGAKTGDAILLTKEIPIETISILAKDFREKLMVILTENEIKTAEMYFENPGISIYKEAKLISDGFGVTSMHDPTEGGLASALWELSTASEKVLNIDINKIPISDLSRKICRLFSINPLNSISSGALLFTADPLRVDEIITILKVNDIHVSVIGKVTQNGVGVYQGVGEQIHLLSRPERDEITKIF